MANKRGILAFSSLFMAAVTISGAWAVDLSVKENVYDMTPVSQLEAKDGNLQASEANMVPVANDGHMNVDDIKSLEYRTPPQSNASEFQPVDSLITPVSLAPGLSEKKN